MLANTFAKYYYVNQTRGFEKWREVMEFERHKEATMRKTLNHWRKHMFYYVKSSLKTWMLNADIAERKGQLKHEEMVFEEAGQARSFQNEQYSNASSSLLRQMD